MNTIRKSFNNNFYNIIYKYQIKHNWFVEIYDENSLFDIIRLEFLTNY